MLVDADSVESVVITLSDSVQWLDLGAILTKRRNDNFNGVSVPIIDPHLKIDYDPAYQTNSLYLVFLSLAFLRKNLPISIILPIDCAIS